MLNAKKIEIVNADPGIEFDLGDGIHLRVLADGEKGSALRLEWNRMALLMPIGLDNSGEAALLGRGLAQPSAALLVADHGSDGATQADWVRIVNPQVALISVGAGNADGDPSPAALRRLAGRTILRTDVNGDLTLFTDGQRLWVETER